MSHPNILAMVALTLALVSNVGAARAQDRSIDGVFATGVDAAKAPLAEGAVDPHWEVRVLAGPWVQPIQELNNFCSSCGNTWLDWPLGDAATSRGITHPDHVRDSSAPGLFSWRQSFDIPQDADLSTITLSYRVGFDDRSRNAADDGDLTGCDHAVWLNGTAYAMTASGNPTRTECQATIPAGSAFAHGANTLEFRITNVTGYYGFRLEGVQGGYDLAAVCGDGIVEGAETCDDANTTDGDGCSSTCQEEDGFGCVEPEFVFNGDFEFGDTGTGGVLPVDPSPLASPCAGTSDFYARDGFYLVTSAPFHSCACDGGQGLCLALNGGGGAVWSQALTGLAPNTTYVVQARHALKGESAPANESTLELAVDGVVLASATPTTSTTPIPYETISATFTTGANQTTALLEFVNPNTSTSGNDGVLDSISVTGPSVCTPPCGDGVLQAGEGCDDSNMVSGDGCSDVCQVEQGWACVGEPSACESLCGNNAIDAGEACDDGNVVSGDGCSSLCRDERQSMTLYSTGVDDAGAPIALGAVDTHWEVRVDADPFVDAIHENNNKCVSCGGAWFNWPIGDAAVSRGISHPSFLRSSFPDRLFSWRQTFTLPAGARPDTATLSYRVGFDNVSRNAADDANLSGCNHAVWLNGTAYAMTASGDPFRTQCQATIPAGSAFVVGANTLEFRITNLSTVYGFRLEKIEGTFLVNCGDGELDEGETCDDGNTSAGDGCSDTCMVEPTYTCSGEPSVCKVLPVCGDGVVEEEESCDDANTVDGDGCSATCVVEPGFRCEGMPSVCMEEPAEPVCGDNIVDMSEACDDGNTTDGDGCSATCEVEKDPTCPDDKEKCEPTTPEPTPPGTTDEGCGVVGTKTPQTPLLLLALLGLLATTRRRRQR